jgi:RNA polymerase sigma-70 factor, ECF subfamily
MAQKNHLTDAVLLHQYVKGNENALAVLVNRHQSKIYGFIYSKIADRDICDDIFQDTFIKVIKTIKTKGYQEEGKFLSWVMRIASNLVIDHFRKAKKMPLQREQEDYNIFDYLKESNLNMEGVMVETQIEKDLQKLVQELPEDQREVIKMRYYEDLSFKEISELTGVSINTALGRMRYAVINLRKMIEKNKIILTN